MPNFTPIGVDAQIKGLGGFIRGLEQMDDKIQSTGGAAGKAQGQFTKSGGTLSKLGTVAGGVALAGVAAAGAGVAALGGGLAASINTAVSFESAFAGVLKTTDGLTDSTGKLNQTGQELRDEFVNLSKEVPLAFEELAAIGELGGQLGIGKESLIDFTETIGALGVATNLTTEEAATAIARFQNIYQVAGEDAGQNTQQVGSAIVALGNNFATTERDITAFAERIAGAGNIAGLTQADVLGIGAAMSSVGVEAEAGGTAIQKVLINMNNAVNGAATGFVDNTEAIEGNVEKMSKLNAESARLEATAPGLQAEILGQYDAFIQAGGSAEQFGRQLGDKTRQKAFDTAMALRELEQETAQLRATQGTPVDAGQLTKFAQVAGVSADDFKELWSEDASQAFQLFVEGLGREGDNAANVLDDLGLADQRLVRGFLSLANAGDLLGESIDLSNKAFEENTALQKEADLRYGTTESQVQLLKNTFRAFGDEIGTRFLPFVNRLIGFGIEFLEKFSGPILDALDNQILPALDRFISVLTEGGGLSELFGSALNAEGFRTSVNEIIANLPTILGNITVAITEWLVSSWPEIQATLSVWAERFWDWVNTAIDNIGPALAGVLAGIAAWATGPGGEQLTQLGVAIGAALVDGIAFIAENQEQFRAVLGKIVLGIGAAVAAVAGLLIVIGGQIVAGILAGILEKLGIELEPATFAELGNVLKGIGQNALIIAKVIGQNIIDGITQGIQEAQQNLESFLIETINGAINSFKEFLGIASPSSLFFGFGLDIIQGLIDGILSLAGNIPETLGNIFSGLFGGGEETTQLPDMSATATQLETVMTSLESISLSFGTTLPESMAVFLEQFLLTINQVYTWLGMVIEQLTAIMTVWLPGILQASNTTTAAMVTGFTNVNTILVQTIALLQQIVASLNAVAAAAKKAIEEMTNFQDAHEPIKKLIDLVDDATEAFKKMAEAAREAATASEDAGTTSEAQTGIGFRQGIGFASGLLGKRTGEIEINVNVGNINNGMDVAQLQNVIRRTVAEAI